MNTSDKKSLQNPLRQATLLFLIRGDEILLAMKKRGMGVGRWNGVGGKPMVGETIIDAAIRETEEEISVTPTSLKKVATLTFTYPNLPQFHDWNQEVVVFFADKWTGEPQESEEMAPQWFLRSEIPFSEMWEDDIHWLPKVLQGNIITGKFTFSKELRLDDFSITEVS